MALQDLLQSAVDAGDVPGAVAIAVKGDGTVIHQGVAGKANLEDGKDMAHDSFFRLFSMSKAVGTTAAAMLIQDGSLELDTPVTDVLPEFADIKVLDHWHGDEPHYSAPETPCTVKHLATHTSGLTYGIWNKTQEKVDGLGANNVLSGERAAYMDTPMVFHPGTRWGYGIGIDWLTLVVEAVSGQRIDAFLNERMFGPLGMVDTVFERDGREDRLVGVHLRGEDGTLTPFPDIGPPPKPEVYGMGHALLGTADDYLRFLRMFLNDGSLDGNQVLTPETISWMFQNHIGDIAIQPMKSTNVMSVPKVDFLNGAHKKHSFGFITNTKDIDGMRRAGSQSWAGVFNTHMWVDPTADVAGVILTQMLPFADERMMALYEAFERETYSLV